MSSLSALEIPYHVVGGSVPERLDRIVDALSLPRVMSVEDAIGLTAQEIATFDAADELTRKDSE